MPSLVKAKLLGSRCVQLLLVETVCMKLSRWRKEAPIPFCFHRNGQLTLSYQFPNVLREIELVFERVVSEVKAFR